VRFVRNRHPFFRIQHIRPAALVAVVDFGGERDADENPVEEHTAVLREHVDFGDAVFGEPDLAVGMRGEELFSPILVEPVFMEAAR